MDLFCSKKLKSLPKTALVFYAGVITALVPVLFLAGRAVSDAALTLVAVLFLTHCVVKKDWGWISKAWVRLIFLIWIYWILGALFAFNTGDALGFALVWIRMPLALIAITYWVLPQTGRGTVYKTALLTLGFVSLDCIYQLITGYDVFGIKIISDSRLTGPFRDLVPGIFMIHMFLFLFPVMIFYAKSRLVSWGSLFFIFFYIAVVIASIIATGERIFGFYALVVLFLIPFFLRHGVWFIFIGVVFVPIVLAVIVQLRPTIGNRIVYDSYAQAIAYKKEIATPGEPNENAEIYAQIHKRALEAIALKPLFGYGFRGFRSYCQWREANDLPSNALGCDNHPHHVYLEWFIQGGLVAMLGLFGLFGLWARELIKALRVAPEHGRILCLSPVFVMMPSFTPLLISESFFDNFYEANFWFAFAVACSFIFWPERYKGTHHLPNASASARGQGKRNAFV